MLECGAFIILVTLLIHYEINIYNLEILSIVERIGLKEKTQEYILNGILAIIILFVKFILSKFNFLKRGFTLKISQQNRKSGEEKTDYHQRNIYEKNRTVKIKLELINTFSIYSGILLQILKNKTVILKMELLDDDKNFIGIEKYGINDGQELFDIKTYLFQILSNNIAGSEEFMYIVYLNLEEDEEKKKEIYIYPKIFINGKDLKEYRVLKYLFKFELREHIVSLDIEKE